MAGRHLMGIDIGGTKTGVCVGTGEGRIEASLRMPSKADSLDDYFSGVGALCRQAAAEAGIGLDAVEAVGISAPGPLSVERGVLIEPPNNPGWREVPVVEAVRRILGRPVFMNNDANACALAEQYFGRHRGVQNLVYLTFSTGMGGGIVMNGQLVQGRTDTGGEVGHHVLDANGPPCGCGQRGCFEAFCGGKNFAERLQDIIRRTGTATSILAHAGGRIEDIDAKAFFRAAKEGDAFALARWEGFVERLAQGVGNLIMILNPDVVLLGTMAVAHGEFVMRPLRERLPRYAWKWPLEACVIEPSSLGERIGDLSAIAVAVAGLGVSPASRG